jgi:iron complex transport system substrate-binding protein
MRLSVHRFIRWLFLGVFAIMLVSSCHMAIDTRMTDEPQPLEDCRTVQHKMGNTCIPQHPKRIVALWMGTFRSSLALNIEPIATVWSPSEPLPRHLQSKLNDADNVVVLGWQPNLEKVLLLKPDLILSNTRFQEIYKQLSKIAPTVVLDHPSPPAPWQSTLSDVAKVLDREQDGKQLVEQYWQRIEQLKKVLGEHLQMQVSIATIDPTYGIYTYGKQHPTGAVMSDIGLQRPAAQRGDFFTKDGISYENLVDIDGDVLFLSYRGGESARMALEKLQKKPLWKTLKVVQQKRVYLVDSDHWYAFDVLAMNAVLDDLEKYLVNMP